MTIEANNVVRLSARDWIAIIAILVVVMTTIGGAYIAHDRLLMQVVTQQQAINGRLDKIENKLENNNSYPDRRPVGGM
jgi:uncharacterized membrane-anchored protein YhcB (DUF1043 family)